MGDTRKRIITCCLLTAALGGTLALPLWGDKATPLAGPYIAPARVGIRAPQRCLPAGAAINGQTSLVPGRTPGLRTGGTLAAADETPTVPLHRGYEEVGGARVSHPRPAASVVSSHARLDALLRGLRQVESGGDDHAVGDGGRARGPYQLWLPYWIDAGGSRATYLVRVCDARACEAAMVRYWKRYCPAALARLDLQTLARVHNGGPAGASNPRTLAYWRRVQLAMRGGA